jgi:hypothetical protein
VSDLIRMFGDQGKWRSLKTGFYFQNEQRASRSRRS